MNLENDIIQSHIIYTSYFGNIQKIAKICPNMCFVSIAGKSPDWFDGIRYKPLMPIYSWWREWHDMFINDLESDYSRSWYIKKYVNTVLSKLKPYDIKNELTMLVNSNNIVLLCYETPEKFCHRHIVADWFNANGIKCIEWKNEDKK